ncbi:MAG: YhfC family intramembrane metalloprotease [Clostridiales bacterium]|nr:YhfC family intramembrane metalloprotease [Clostridiales bacterium]
MYEVSQVTTMNMWITAVVSIFLPIVLLVMWKKKKKVRISPFFIGALTFIAFALILENICHQFFLVRESALSRFMNENTWAYVLYAALAAGIFEETGRFIAFKFFMKNNDKKEDAITYGIGHGGIESILVVGFSMLSSIFLISTLKSMGGIDGYVAMVPVESQELVRTSLMSLYTTPPYIYLLGAVERVATIAFHIALSFFVFMAVKRPGKLYFYPVAILLHVFLDIFAVLYQREVITNMIIMEAIIIAITLVTAYFAYRLYQKDAAVEASETVSQN